MKPVPAIVLSRPRRLLVLGCLVAGCSTAGGHAVTCPPSPFRSTPPVVIAHAGGDGLGPGNTITAMERSVAAGADVLDADLRMTGDGVIVARHDRDVATTTDGQGNVDELMWRDLQRLDAAATWRGPPVDGDVGIPTLEAVLERFPEHRMSLEIKQVTPSLADELCAVLRRTGATDRVYLSANEDAGLYDAKEACPEVLITTSYRDLDRMRAADATDEAWCAPSPIGQPPYRDGRFDTARVETSHRRGMALYTWTVDDAETLRALALAGVDGVYTRRPDVARAVFDGL